MAYRLRFFLSPSSRFYRHCCRLIRLQTFVASKYLHLKCCGGIIVGNIDYRGIAQRLATDNAFFPTLSQHLQVLLFPQFTLLCESCPWANLVGCFRNDICEGMTYCMSVASAMSNMVARLYDRCYRKDKGCTQFLLIFNFRIYNFKCQLMTLWPTSLFTWDFQPHAKNACISFARFSLSSSNWI